METKIKKFFALFVSAIMSVLFAACDQNSHSAMAVNAPTEEDLVPKTFSFTSANEVKVIDGFGTIVDGRVAHSLGLVAEDTIRKAGVEGIVPEEGLNKGVSSSNMYFSYNYEINNKLEVSGLMLQYDYKGKTYSLYCADELQLRGEHEVTSSENKENASLFFEASKTTYSLVAINRATKAEIVVATVEQAFEVRENYVAPVLESIVYVDSRHQAYNPTAVVDGDLLIVAGKNIADVKEIWSNGTEKSKEIPYDLTHRFNVAASKIVVDDANKVIGKSYKVEDGNVSIEGADFSFEYCNCEISPVVYENEDFTDQVKRCAPSVRMLTVKSATEAELCIYEDDAEDCAMAKLPISIEEKGKPVVVTFDGMFDGFTHQSYRAYAIASAGNVQNVICDNLYTGTAKYSDGTTKEAASINYTWTNRFNVEVPAMELLNPAAIYGIPYELNDGQVIVEGYTVKVNFIDREVSEIKYSFEGQTYDKTSSAPICTAEAKSVTFNADGTMTVVFDGEGEVIEGKVPVTITKKVTFDGMFDEYTHNAYRAYAIASAGNVQNVICDNLYTGTAKYSDGTSKLAASINYTWTNQFKVEVPAMEVASAAAIYGNTYELTNGVAFVEGYEIKVSFTGRQVSEIIYNFEGNVYDKTNAAPTCSATAKSIRFNADGTMTVVFDGEGERVEGSVPVTITEKIEAKKLEGTILAGYTTDSYWDHVSNIEGTYQHIVTILENGSYKHYSRREGDKDFVVEELTSAQGQALLAQSRAFAWYRSGNSYLLGTVEAFERDGYSDRFLLIYYDMNGNVAHYLGKAEETIGNPFRYPVRSTLQATPQGWTFGDGEYFN